MIGCKEFITPTIFPSQKRGCGQDRWRSLTMTKKKKTSMTLIIKLHLALHRFTVKFILRNFHHFQYTFFRPLDCDANPCKNGGTCVEVPSRKTYKCNCTDAFTGKNCSEPTPVASSTDASHEYSKLYIFSSLFPFQRYPKNSTCHSLWCHYHDQMPRIPYQIKKIQ